MARDIPWIDIELDKPRRMALPLGALAKAERELNRRSRAAGYEKEVYVLKVIDEQLKGIASGEASLDILCVLVWASLTSDDKTITIEAVEEMISDPMYAAQKLYLCITKWLASPTDAPMAGTA